MILLKYSPSFLIFSFFMLVSNGLWADNRADIASKSGVALKDLYRHAVGSKVLLAKAAGILVFPDIVKMGFGTGGQYGEGALMVGGEPVAYYATSGAKYGLQDGDSNKKAEVILFMTKQALIDFRNSRSWEVGVSAGVSPVKLNAGGEIESKREAGAVLSFIFSEQGLLPNLSVSGSKINRIAR